MPTAYHSPSGLWATILAGLLACLGGAATISEVAAHGGSVPVFTTADPEKAVEQRTPLSIAVTAPVRGGSWIAYTAVDRDGTSSAYLVSADGSESREIRHGARPGTLREWSRDGSSLLFCGALDYASGAAGDECTEPFSVAPYLHDPASLTYLDSRPRLSPDGRTLAFVRIHDAEPHRAALMTVDLLSGVSAHVVGFEANVQPGIDWSPDGRLLAFVSKPRGAGGTALWVVSVHDFRARRIAGLPHGWTASSPTFSPDGASIAMGVSEGRRRGIAIARTDGGPLRTIATFRSLTASALDWNPVDHGRSPALPEGLKGVGTGQR